MLEVHILEIILNTEYEMGKLQYAWLLFGSKCIVIKFYLYQPEANDMTVTLLLLSSCMRLVRVFI